MYPVSDAFREAIVSCDQRAVVRVVVELDGSELGVLPLTGGAVDCDGTRDGALRSLSLTVSPHPDAFDWLATAGAEVVVAPTAVAPDSPESYYRVADRLTEEIPGAFQPNQYFNPANPASHYASTGPELWEQSGGAITHLVVGVGTGGTVTGVGRYLKERNPAIQQALDELDRLVQ